MGSALIAALVVAVATVTGAALAQQQLPGIVLTVPPANPAPPAPPPAAAPPVETPKAKAKPGTAPKAARQRPADTASADTNEASVGLGGGSGARAALKVNGEPITAFEIEQRARLLSLQANIGQRAQENLKQMVSSEAVSNRWRQIVDETVKANPGRTRDQVMAILEKRRAELGASLQRDAVARAKASVLPKLREEARKELIEEILKLQEARRVGAKVDESEVQTIVNNLAQQNKMTAAQFEKHFAGMGVDLTTLKAKFRTNIAWGEVVRRKFSFLVNPNQREIDRIVANAQGGEDDVELQLQRIVISVGGKIDQRLMAQRFAEADALRKDFAGCKTLAGLAAKLQGARVDVIGSRRPANFQEPTRTLLANAQPGEMLPPNIVSQGVELMAVCERRVVKADEKRRNEAAADIRQKEFEIQARRLLRDLQQEAVIEMVGK